MEPTQMIDGTCYEDGASKDATLSDRRVSPGTAWMDHHQTQGHRFEAVTTNDNARVHMGDVHGGQHTYYYGAPPSQPHAREMSLLEALAFEQMDFRSATIAPAYARTCDWLFSALPYQRWRNQDLAPKHHGFLWIKGKPGAGKSTLMKHALEHAQVTFGHEQVVSFFFNARGTALGKSVEGMYRSLLHQMVGQVPSLSNKVAVTDRSAYRSNGWPVAILQDLFRQAMLQLCRTTRVNCYIDALDEGEDEDEVRGMVEFFYGLAERAVSDNMPFYVCLASRYYPKISVSAFEELRLEDHRGHDADISDYVRNKLRLGDEELKQQLSAEIERRSSGVFLWVVLVVTMLNKEGDRGNQHLLSTRLQEIPDGLFQLIQDVRTRDASDDRFLPALEWVLYALRPLEPEQLYMAILVSTGVLTTEPLHWIQQSVDTKTIDDFILSSSKGLLEIVVEESASEHDHGVQSDWEAEAEEIFLRIATPRQISRAQPQSRSSRRVQFIHEVVRHYFLSASDFGCENAAISHNRLSGICQTYIRIAYAKKLTLELQTSNKTSAARQFPTQHVPLLRYSVDMVLEHADLASKYGCHASDLSQNFPWDEWVFYQSTTLAAKKYHRRTTWLQKVTYIDHLHLVKDELCYIRSSKTQEEVHALLDACVPELGSALHISAKQSHFSQCLQVLVDNGANVNQTCENIGSPLHVLARNHDALGVLYLLEHGADATLMDDKGNLALHYAIQSRDIRVIEALCGDGFPEGSIGVCGDVAQTAGQLNDWMFMRVLSDLGAHVDALDFSPDGPYTNRHWVLRDFSRGRPPEYDFPALLNSE